MTVAARPVRVDPDWLVLREPADAAARSVELAVRLARHLANVERLVVHDLGAGSGAMGRWLARLLPGRQHWVLHDRDADLLDLALARVPDRAADGAAITVEGRPSDVACLAPSELASASVVVASALLDLLTEDELAAMLGTCVGVGCPLLLALTVAGRVTLTPADPLDADVQAAFNAHQRRTTPRGRLLGPDAVASATSWLGATGARVLLRPSVWRLGAPDVDLLVAWLEGWIGAAREQEPALAADVDAYRNRRLAQASAGELAVTVDHADLLVLR